MGVSMATRVLLLACCLAVAAASKNVLNANDGNFDKEVLNSGKNSIVKFLAPW